MASLEDIKAAFGCLSTVFPQYVAKELASLTDDVATAIQGFTDPLAALGDINLDALISGAADITEGDTFSKLGGVAVGLTAQYVQREGGSILQSISDEYPNVTKRVQQIANRSGQVITALSSLMALYPDMPYAAAQRMCETIVELTDLKANNLRCLRKHIVQLVNAILVLARSVDTYKDSTFSDLDLVVTKLEQVSVALAESTRLGVTGLVFDSQAFERARDGLLVVNGLLTPDANGTNVMDAANILVFGSVKTADVTLSDQKLVLMVIPALTNLIEAEVGAVVGQMRMINYYVTCLGKTVARYRNVGKTSRVQEQRLRAVQEMQARILELTARINLARDRQALGAVSSQMLLWSSRVRTILATMDHVHDLTLQEGSIEGPDKAFLLEKRFEGLLTGLASINNHVTFDGIEDPTTLHNQVLSLTIATKRVMKDIDAKQTNANRLASLHGRAAAVATAQMNSIDLSLAVATNQSTLCQQFAEIDLQAGAIYHQTLDSLRHLGLDRAVDLLSSGSFEDLLNSDLSGMSYLGVAIQCLQHGLAATEDVQTRLQISAIRDDMIGQQTNVLLAIADTADQGRGRYVDRLKLQIGIIQKNAQTISAIVGELKKIMVTAGADLGESVAGLQAIYDQTSPLASNLDQLAVAAGGRLSAVLEDVSAHPNGGVVRCD